MFADLPQHVRKAYDQAVEDFRNSRASGTLKPNTPQWEAAVKLAIAQLPMDAHEAAFRDYLRKMLAQKTPKCQRNDDTVICVDGPNKFNTPCDLCGKNMFKI